MAEITASTVRELRERTGIGMMACKKALQETDGDLDQAVDYLRRQGMAAVEKRSTRDALEGLVTSYIHPGNRLGVLVEVNCETDFVARTDDFQQFAKDVAMHIAAEQPTAVDRQSLDPQLIEHERSIYLEQAKNEGRPENIAEKIVSGRLEKFYQQTCLMDQAFVKDPNQSIEGLVTQLTARIGEKISISRFSCFRLGERD